MVYILIVYSLSKQAWWMPWVNTKFTFGGSPVIFFFPYVQLEHCSTSLQKTTTSTSALYYEGFACSFHHLTSFEDLGRCRSQCGRLGTPTQRLHIAQGCVLCSTLKGVLPADKEWTSRGTLTNTSLQQPLDRYTDSNYARIKHRKMTDKLFYQHNCSLKNA